MAIHNVLISHRVLGKYKLDLEVYHRVVKPVFLNRFREAYSTRTFDKLYGLSFSTNLISLDTAQKVRHQPGL